MKAKTSIYDSAEGYDLAVDEYDKKEAYLNSFEKNCWSCLLPDLKDKAVLDVGAGTGRLAILMSRLGAKVTALDVSERMLERLKKKQRSISTVVGDAEDLPFEDNSFDIITGAFLLVHLKEPGIFFQEAERVLNPGGLLIITNINQKEAPVIKTKQREIKIKSYYHRPEQIIGDVENCGFKIKQEKIIEEGGVWVNQVVIAEK